MCLCVYSSGAAIEALTAAESDLLSFFLFFSSSGAVIKALTAASKLCESAPNSTYFFPFSLFFFPFSGAAIEALTAAIQLCESAPNSSKAVKRSAECHELLAICFQQVRLFTCLLVALLVALLVG